MAPEAPEVWARGRSTRPAQGHSLQAVLAFVLIVNSVAVAYGFYQLRLISDVFRWSVAPGLAAIAADRRLADPGDGGPTVDVYYSFSCPACRAGALAIDSVRGAFAEMVRWQTHFVSLGPKRDPAGFRAALLAACAKGDQVQTFLTSLVNDEPISAEQVDEAAMASGMLPDDLAACLQSEEPIRKVWQESFNAHADGILGTPTVVVNGFGVQGPLTVVALEEFIGSFLEEGKEPTG